MKQLFNKEFGIAALDKIALDLKLFLLKNKKVMFKGEVGAGKTTLVKALAKAFNVLDDVDSPTFSLVNEYNGEIDIFHFDLYRLKGYEELLDIGWEEYLDGGNHIWVEWPENAPEAFDEEFLLIRLEKLENENRRRVELWEI